MELSASLDIKMNRTSNLISSLGFTHPGIGNCQLNSLSHVVGAKIIIQGVKVKAMYSNQDLRRGRIFSNLNNAKTIASSCTIVDLLE